MHPWIGNIPAFDVMLRGDAILLIGASVERLLFPNTLVKSNKPQFVLGFTFVQRNLRAARACAGADGFLTNAMK